MSPGYCPDKEGEVFGEGPEARDVLYRPTRNSHFGAKWRDQLPLKTLPVSRRPGPAAWQGRR